MVGTEFTAIVKSMVIELANPIIGFFFREIDFVNLFVLLNSENNFDSLQVAYYLSAVIVCYVMC